MYEEDDPIKEAVGVGVGAAATVAKGAFRLGQINVTSNRIIAFGWLASCGLFFFAYSISGWANPGGPTFNSQNSGNLAFANCLACIGMLGGVLMLPMTFGWFTNKVLRAGNQPKGASPRTTQAPPLRPANDQSQDGLFMGEQIRHDE